jgi:ferredoxin
VIAGKRIALVHFSATDVTHTYARVMRDALLELGREADLLNVTSHAARQKPLPLDDYASAIFGFPVFADFAPSVINDWLPGLDGRGKACTQFFTYGARTSGYAHFHTKLLLEQAGFQVLFSAEFLGRHSFNVGGWRMALDRPNETDFRVARQYVALAVERFSQKAPPVFRLQRPFGYNQTLAAAESRQRKGGEGGWADPGRRTDECSMCGDCETECPTGAFDAARGVSDPGKCIECMRCVYICPDGVIKAHERVAAAYEGFLAHWHLTDEMMASKESRIITEPWHAAS